MKKLLYTASTARHILDNHMEILRLLALEGWEVTVACRNTDALPDSLKVLELPYAKSFFSLENLRAWRLLRRLLRKEAYDALLTHTALAGFIARMAVYPGGKKKPFCLHTVHGYLFGRYAPLPGKMTYIFERMCKSVTDCLVTMNNEDFHYAKKLVRNGENVLTCPGMGVDTERFFPVDAEEKVRIRRELGLPLKGFLLFYAAEHSFRKNHANLLAALPKMCEQQPNLMLILAGDGKLLAKNQLIVKKMGMDGNVRFLGYVTDTAPWLKACDMAVSASFSEGLPVGITEAICCGLPVAASRVKGHVDLLESNPDSLFDPLKPLEIAHCVMNFEQKMVYEVRVLARLEAAKVFCRLFSTSFDRFLTKRLDY